MTEPIEYSALGIDLSPRVRTSSAVVGSPAAGAETIVASLTLDKGLTIVSGVLLVVTVAFTVGTNGVTAEVKLRQTDTSGTTVATTGATTVVATNLVERALMGFDTAPAAGQVYKATLTIGSGSAASAVSAVCLLAIPC